MLDLGLHNPETMTISEIRDIHPPVADLVCQRIKEQGNEPDESKAVGSQFVYDETPEGHDAWWDIFHESNFEPLFKLYPELRGGKREIDGYVNGSDFYPADSPSLTEEMKKEMRAVKFV